MNIQYAQDNANVLILQPSLVQIRSTALMSDISNRFTFSFEDFSKT
jgi:hypothetical protein